MSLSIPSFLKPTLPTAPAPRSGGAKAAERALKDIRQDAKDMRKALAAPPAAPMAVGTVGAYNPQAWSLLNDVKKLLQAIGHLLAGMNGAPPSPQPTNPGPSTPPKPPTGVTRFNVSSFNILGSNHTMRGNKYLRGPERARLAAELLAQKDVHVVGFQEMANDQVTAFMGASGGKFGIYPGNSLGKWGSQNSIAWRKDTWDFVKAQHHEIPFLNGMKRQIPVVLLRNKETGQQAYFTNFHNAAHRKGGPDQQKFRDAATDIEIALVNRLKRESGLPVIVTGDMNEKQNYFKRMTREADMTSANFGDIKGVPKQTGIDWIFGSEGVKFKGFHRERGALQQKISDHATLVSQVQIG
jgi:endonuclease/exonuclease/phosphatase family metal-dependent hydrolase